MKRTRKYIAALAVFAAGSVFYGSLPAHAGGIELDEVGITFRRNHDDAESNAPTPPEMNRQAPRGDMQPQPHEPRGHMRPQSREPRGHMQPQHVEGRRGFEESRGHMQPKPHEQRGHMQPQPRHKW